MKLLIDILYYGLIGSVLLACLYGGFKADFEIQKEAVRQVLQEQKK